MPTLLNAQPTAPSIHRLSYWPQRPKAKKIETNKPNQRPPKISETEHHQHYRQHQQRPQQPQQQHFQFALPQRQHLSTYRDKGVPREHYLRPILFVGKGPKLAQTQQEQAGIVGTLPVSSASKHQKTASSEHGERRAAPIERPPSHPASQLRNLTLRTYLYLPMYVCLALRPIPSTERNRNS